MNDSLPKEGIFCKDGRLLWGGLNITEGLLDCGGLDKTEICGGLADLLGLGLLPDAVPNLGNVDRLRGVRAAAKRSSWQANRRTLPFCEEEVSEDPALESEMLLRRDAGGVGSEMLLRRDWGGDTD
jgi:hypothetical protein